ncbi:hypothetical protein QOT17_006183 [Balamuthia mandrillaris]
MTMRLHWTIREEDGGNSGNGGSDNRTIELALESSATGWSAIGLSTDGTMTSSGRGSDIMLGWISDPVVREEGETSPEGPARRQEAEEDCSSGCLHDYWVERKFPTPPVRMDEQWGEGGRADLLLVAAEESDGMTSFEWDRALDTGDTVADRVIDPSVETFGERLSRFSLAYACIPFLILSFDPPKLFSLPIVTLSQRAAGPSVDIHGQRIRVCQYNSIKAVRFLLLLHLLFFWVFFFFFSIILLFG